MSIWIQNHDQEYTSLRMKSYVQNVCLVAVKYVDVFVKKKCICSAYFELTWSID